MFHDTSWAKEREREQDFMIFIGQTILHCTIFFYSPRKIRLLKNTIYFSHSSRPATVKRVIPGTQLPPLESAGAAEAVSPGPEAGSAVGGKIDRRQWRVSAGRPLSATKRRPRVGAENLRRVASSASSTTTITPCRYDKNYRFFLTPYCFFYRSWNCNWKWSRDSGNTPQQGAIDLERCFRKTNYFNSILFFHVWKHNLRGVMLSQELY